MNIFQPDNSLFKRNYNSGLDQIIFASFTADLQTPVSVLIKLTKEKFKFLFESVEKGSQKGRYSVIGLKPDIIWECTDNKCNITYFPEKKKKKSKKILSRVLAD